MPRRQDAKAPPEFNFITFGEPSQSMSTKAIRSHAAKVGWKSRKGTTKRLPTRSEDDPSEPDTVPVNRFPVPDSWSAESTPGVGSYRTTPSLSSPVSQTSSSAPSSCPTPLVSSSPVITTNKDLVDQTSAIRLENPASEDDVEELPRRPSLAVSKNQSRPNVVSSKESLLCRPVGPASDPFSQFPIQWEYPFGSLVHFYKNCLGEVWFKIITVNWGIEGNREFTEYPLKISIENQEPALFYAVLSNASVMSPPSNVISMRQQPYLSQWLRSKVIASLRDAIADPQRAYTDSVICTVDFLYLNECLRGEGENAQNIHGPALRRMVAARGGIYAIASQGRDGLILSRMLSWSDRIAASTSRIPLLFPDYTEDPSLTQTQWSGIWSKVQTLM